MTVPDIRFEFDILIKGERSSAFDQFALENPDWRCQCGKNGGFLAEPPQLADFGQDSNAFVVRHIDKYAAQLSFLRSIGHGHSIRVAVYFDPEQVAAISLGLKPSTMALVSTLGYEVDFSLYSSCAYQDG